MNTEAFELSGSLRLLWSDEGFCTASQVTQELQRASRTAIEPKDQRISLAANTMYPYRSNPERLTACLPAVFPEIMLTSSKSTHHYY